MTPQRWAELEAKDVHRLTSPEWTEIKSYVQWLQSRVKVLLKDNTFLYETCRSLERELDD